MQPAIATATTGPLVDTFRIGVYNDTWDRIINVFESTFGKVLFEYTRRKLSLGTQDTVTGYYAKTFTDETVKGVLIEKSNTKLQVAAGTYVKYDAVLMTADPVLEGDMVKTQEDVYYDVLAVTEHFNGDSFTYRDCDLTKNPLYEE